MTCSRSPAPAFNNLKAAMIAAAILVFPAAVPTAFAKEPPMNAQTLSLGTQQLSYLKVGQGPAVVLIHGIGGHKEDWIGVATALSHQHTVYAIDMLGFGGSSKDAPAITIGGQSDAVIALLDAEHLDKADLVGNSVGGWVAATVAADHPDRVRKLVLVDAAGLKAMFQGPSPVNFYPTTVEEMEKLLATVRHDPSTHTPAYARQALAASQASGDGQAAEKVFGGMAASTRLEDVCDKITAPTLVIWGAEDMLFPPAVADLVVGHTKGATKVLIPDASHFPQLDNPPVFDKIVADFLAH